VSGGGSNTCTTQACADCTHAGTSTGDTLDSPVVARRRSVPGRRWRRRLGRGRAFQQFHRDRGVDVKVRAVPVDEQQHRLDGFELGVAVLVDLPNQAIGLTGGQLPPRMKAGLLRWSRRESTKSSSRRYRSRRRSRIDCRARCADELRTTAREHGSRRLARGPGGSPRTLPRVNGPPRAAFRLQPGNRGTGRPGGAGSHRHSIGYRWGHLRPSTRTADDRQDHPVAARSEVSGLGGCVNSTFRGAGTVG
jgi:hypothetical protein